jgi:hypothetical protein
METLYSAENGIVREFTEEEYRQHEADLQLYYGTNLPINLRNQRNELLSKCDWTQVVDSPLTVEQKTAWATYRQALRDVTKQSGFPTNVNWPTQP